MGKGHSDGVRYSIRALGKNFKASVALGWRRLREKLSKCRRRPCCSLPTKTGASTMSAVARLWIAGESLIQEAIKLRPHARRYQSEVGFAAQLGGGLGTPVS